MESIYSLSQHQKYTNVVGRFHATVEYLRSCTSTTINVVVA
jgi:hypothetical protein